MPIPANYFLQQQLPWGFNNSYLRQDILFLAQSGGEGTDYFLGSQGKTKASEGTHCMVYLGDWGILTDGTKKQITGFIRDRYL